MIGARWIKDRGDRWTRSYHGLYAENLDAVQGMATLKAFNPAGAAGGSWPAGPRPGQPVRL